MEPENVFTPGRYPKVNFIEREEFQPEETIQWARKAGSPIHLVGPPDSGKTSLAKHTAADQPLLTVAGTDLDTHQDVAKQLFDELTDENDTVPPALTPSAELIERVRDQPKDQMRVVNSALDTGDIAVLYDGFHAIPGELQVYVAQLIKGQFERGVDLFITSASSDGADLFIANGDLRGRVRSIDVPTWETAELRLIAHNGFEVLGVDIGEKTIERLVNQADGSPTEMHRLCLRAL